MGQGPWRPARAQKLTIAQTAAAEARANGPSCFQLNRTPWPC